MTGRFVASCRVTSSWAVSVSYISVTFLHALWLTFGVGVVATSTGVTVSEGDNVTLNCSLNGFNINWTFKGKTELGTRHYEIPMINRSQSGWYKCQNSISHENHTVTVEYGAEGMIAMNVTNVTLWSTLNISCKVEGVPPVHEIAWFFCYDNGTCTQKNDSFNETHFVAHNVTCSMQGTYKCRPTNNVSNARNGSTEVHVRGCTLPSTTPVPSNTKVVADGSTEPRKQEPEASTTPVPSNTKAVADGLTEQPKQEPEALIISLGVFGGIIVILMTIGLYLLLRRRVQCCCKAYCNGFFSVQREPTPPSPNKRRPSLIGVTKLKHGAIPVDDFFHHVKVLHTDGDYRFNQEFEQLKNVHVKSRTWIHSEKAENQSKNRYGNIVAYDHSRVILTPTQNEPDSHYINANYVDSYEKRNAYIATQGPMANTIKDFWRMVWEQNCTVVVMITNIIEKGRHKCAMYWPSRQARSEVHGPLRITYLDEEAFAFYTVRRFEVKPVDQNSHYCQDLTDEVKPMTVSQYHFTGWPDHGAPDAGCEYPALSFILKSAAASQDGAGPIIVHCSAGVGRSGAYIVIHSMVKRIHVTGDVNVFDFLSQIRQQRNLLVQEECQYIFVHDAVLHYIESCFQLSIPIDDLKHHLQLPRKNLSNQSRLDIELQNLNAVQVKHYNLKQAKRGCNIGKNRSVDYIPADSARVELFPRPREEGSDYINASYLPGFWKSQAYIATQYPLEDTTDDFWRMVWQENCRSLVMLVSKTELEEDYYHSYVPAAYETCRFGEYEVTVDSMQTRGDIVVKELKMACIKDPSEYRNIRHFHFLHWPEDANPWSGQTILQLICKVDEWEKEVRVYAKPFEIIGPVVVHCNYGVGRTGAYCLLHTMYHQIKRDNTVSIYQMARLYNHQRPLCISRQEHYEFCYDTLVEYIGADCSLHLV